MQGLNWAELIMSDKGEQEERRKESKPEVLNEGRELERKEGISRQDGLFVVTNL